MYPARTMGSYAAPAHAYAPAGRRLGAWVIDWFAAMALAVVPATVLALVFYFTLGDLPGIDSGEQGGDVAHRTLVFSVGFILGYGLVYLAYQTIATARGGGVGKRLMDLLVVEERTGEPLPYGMAFGRSIIGPLLWCYLNIAWWIDSAWCLWDAKNQTLHDKVCGTVVIIAAPVADR